jgi:hypothetical protein
MVGWPSGYRGCPARNRPSASLVTSPAAERKSPNRAGLERVERGPHLGEVFPDRTNSGLNSVAPYVDHGCSVAPGGTGCNPARCVLSARHVCSVVGWCSTGRQRPGGQAELDSTGTAVTVAGHLGSPAARAGPHLVVPGRGGSSERRPRCLTASVPFTNPAEPPVYASLYLPVVPRVGFRVGFRLTRPGPAR